MCEFCKFSDVKTKETYSKILRVYSNEYIKIQIDGESIGRPYYKKHLKFLEKRIKGLIRDHSDLIK